MPVITAVDLARRMKIEPKTFRSWLRAEAESGNPLLLGHLRHERWVFDEETAAEIERAFRQRTPHEPTVLEKSATTAREWFWEGSVQEALIAHLVEQGWEIKQAVSTLSRERGIDVIAAKPPRILAVEVKGYPSTVYARGPKVGQPKPTSPRLQARHWFAEALRAAIATPSVLSEAELAIAFPRHERFEELVSGSEWALRRLGIGIYFVDETGGVTERLPHLPRVTS